MARTEALLGLLIEDTHGAHSRWIGRWHSFCSSGKCAGASAAAAPVRAPHTSARGGGRPCPGTEHPGTGELTGNNRPLRRAGWVPGAALSTGYAPRFKSTHLGLGLTKSWPDPVGKPCSQWLLSFQEHSPPRGQEGQRSAALLCGCSCCWHPDRSPMAGVPGPLCGPPQTCMQWRVLGGPALQVS